MYSNGLESLTELYRIGYGPSSSHTIGPQFACESFLKKYPQSDGFKVVLYGSLAKTGKGHGTDVVCKKTFAPKKCDVVFDCEKTDLPHPNTLDIFAFKSGAEIGYERYLSVGGGKIVSGGDAPDKVVFVYPHTSFSEIKAYLEAENLRLPEYVDRFEGNFVNDYLLKVYAEMKNCIQRGLEGKGVLPGGLNVARRAGFLYGAAQENEPSDIRENRLICAYAFAIGEENASFSKVVTAPTCGAAGVVPAVLYYAQTKNAYSDMQIVNALKTASVIGNLIKKNASISGAECGCQAEIGTACAMAAAALAELKGMTIDTVEYAAEIAIEHHLGLTCDPICGLVQIPCIERNAVAAVRAVNAVLLAGLLFHTRKISFDNVVAAMKETGKDMNCRYKETSEGGLAHIKI